MAEEVTNRLQEGKNMGKAAMYVEGEHDIQKNKEGVV